MVAGEPVLAYGAVRRCAKNIGVSGPAISKVWKHMKTKFMEEGIMTSSPVKRKSIPLLYCRDELMNKIEEIPHCDRRTLRDLSAELGIGKTTLFRILRSETDADGMRYLVPHTNFRHRKMSWREQGNGRWKTKLRNKWKQTNKWKHTKWKRQKHFNV